MKKQEGHSVHFTVENLIKIMNDRKLTKSYFAELIEFPETKWNKISNGNQELRVGELSKIAKKLQIKEIDIYTYPKKFVEIDHKSDDIKAQLTIELKENMKSQVLSLIFGNENVRVLNK
jgi:DNA-binding Xre family transcriptional regulator